MKTLLYAFVLILIPIADMNAQNETSSNNEFSLDEYVFTAKDLQDPSLSKFFAEKMEDTQFVMLGEQHGIKEVGELTNLLFTVGNPLGYKYLCIETDELAAETIESIVKNSDNPKAELQKLYSDYPLSIPFYDNPNDISLFNNVISNNGTIWGIDQTFMGQFRFNYNFLLENSDNEELKKAVQPLYEASINAFDEAMTTKDFSKMYILKYTDDTHNTLLNLAKSPREIEILNQFQLTKEIYGYNFQQQYYLNNYVRSMLMKNNFIRYYKAASKDEELPKVIFKLGANHTYRGLNYTKVFDISNLVSELAIFNNKKSLHVYATGLRGTIKNGNPMAPEPISSFDNSKDLPEELMKIANNTADKYIIIDAQALRPLYYKLPKEHQELVLKFDILVYIKDAEALDNF